MNLDLAHATPATVAQITEVLAGAFGLALAALLVLAFTRTWRGLVAGFLILGCVLGGGSYYALHAKASFSTAGIREQNAQRLIEAAAKTYDVKITEPQAKKMLVGTDSYAPTSGVTTKFGTVTLTVHERPYPDDRQPVSLVWRKNAWHLLIIQPDASYNEVQRVGQSA
jgi:hypothetical protein